ncbi:MAG: hypothetical protein DHS20C14_15380 [Phycisphaeraceae bacterium]|nr:MAG: hypothetical protein DHS20C14_15380 [Phycisphaeraceae bacterium]
MRAAFLCVGVMAALLPGFGCAVATPEDDAIDALAGRLTEAVRSSDGGSFLADVDLSDPYFAHEQRYLANAVTGDAVPAFELERAGRTRAEGDTLVAPVRVRWQPSAEAEARSATFDARFTRDAAGVWRYAGEDWEHARSDDPRIRVLATPELEVEAELVRSAYARVAPRVEAFFEVSGAELPPVKLYDNVAHLQLSISPTYDPPLGGWYEPGESIKMLWRTGRTPESIERVIAHELGHALYFAMGIERDATPWWAHEGVAEAAASSIHDKLAGVNERLAKLAAGDKLVEFEFLAVFDEDTFMQQRLAYPMGHSMVAYVLERFGRERGFAWLVALGALGVDEASKQALGMGFDALDRDWRATLQPSDDAAAETDTAAP